MSDQDLPPLRWALRERQEEVTRRLQDAFVAGYLEDDELDLRLERAQSAADLAALERVLEGLPTPYPSRRSPARPRLHQTPLCTWRIQRPPRQTAPWFRSPAPPST